MEKVIEFNFYGYCSQFDVYCSYYYAKLNTYDKKCVPFGDYFFVFKNYVYKVNVLGRTCYKIGESLDSVIFKDEAQS